jgi:hypothetical protein
MKRAKPMARNRTIDAQSTEYAHSMARGLGWFSIGLGLAEVLAPRTVTRAAWKETSNSYRRWPARNRHRNWDSLVGPACAMDMGTCRR